MWIFIVFKEKKAGEIHSFGPPSKFWGHRAQWSITELPAPCKWAGSQQHLSFPVRPRLLLSIGDDKFGTTVSSEYFLTEWGQGHFRTGEPLRYSHHILKLLSCSHACCLSSKHTSCPSDSAHTVGIFGETGASSEAGSRVGEGEGGYWSQLLGEEMMGSYG